jgi:polyhydroxyalkanoate synthase subunit PhaC
MNAERHDGSRWQDWASWADERAGRLGPPPPMGSGRYPTLGEAPGDYVRG